jgi:hypothetical protein
MDKDSIDASVGLRFSLELLKKYQESGLLQAVVSRLPGVSGKCEVSITIMQGTVTSCLAKDQKGHIYTVDINVLLKIDKDRGPFEWNLLPLAEQTHSSSEELPLPIPRPEQSRQHRNYTYKPFNSPTPYIIANLNLNLLTSWTPEQRQALFKLYSLVDGHKTIDDIKQAVSLSSELVEEGLRVLVSMNVIAISS